MSPDLMRKSPWILGSSPLCSDLLTVSTFDVSRSNVLPHVIVTFCECNILIKC